MLWSLRRAASLALLVAHQASCQPGLDFAGDQAPLGVAAENVTTGNCHQACKQLLAAGHAELVTFYPELPSEFEKQYYAAQQREMTPICVAQPSSAAAVSLVLTSIREHKCPFAVKSGGNSIAPGTSNIPNGLVLDLVRFNQIEVSDDKKTVSVGPAARWSAVYQKLDALGITVVGGRVASVGVGGLIMGGGLSYLSSRYGWALDNVRNFEVVLPNGTLTNASPTVHPGLFFALRGGGVNFGVVTRFDLVAYPHAVIWSGTNMNFMKDLPEREAALSLSSRFDWSFNSVAIRTVKWLQKVGASFGYGVRGEELIRAFVNLGMENSGPAPHAYIFLVWIPTLRGYGIGTTYVHSGGEEERPAVLEKLAAVPHLYSSARIANVSEFVDETTKIHTPGLRHIWRSVTFKLNAEFISKLWDLILVEFDAFTYSNPEAVMSTNMQLLTKQHLVSSSKNGGNAYGIDPEDGPLFVFGITIFYNSAQDDEAFAEVAARLTAKAVELGKQMEVHHPFIYRNYATADQDVFAGYSSESRQRLVDLQEIYDPGRVFARLIPANLAL